MDDFYDLLLASEDSLDFWDDRWEDRDEEEDMQMARLVTDPREVERLAEEREDENWAFRNWIKMEFGFDDERLIGIRRRLRGALAAARALPAARRQPVPCL